MSRQPRALVGAACLAFAVAAAGCTAGGGQGQPASPATMAAGVVAGLIQLVPEYTGSAPECVERPYWLPGLTTTALAGMDAEVELGDPGPRAVARQWLRAAGLAAP